MFNVQRIDDQDSVVTKLVFTKNDAVAESVLYRYPTFKDRTVICCSTQSGCTENCSFCGTGKFFIRSLTADEIVEQVKECLHIAEQTDHIASTEIDKLQIMFMSMGEPLRNYNNVSPAIAELYKLYPNAQLLISTVGPKVSENTWHQLIIDSINNPKIGLQFSVHESTNEKRNLIVPPNGKMNLEEIAAAGVEWSKVTGRKAFFNYCATPHNCSKDDADRLEQLFDSAYWNCTISVVCETDESLAKAAERNRSSVDNFAALMTERGFNVRTFDPYGQDTIGAGCGQLWYVQDWVKKNKELVKLT